MCNSLQEVKSISQQLRKVKKHDKRVLLAKSMLRKIKVLISQTLIDSNISQILTIKYCL